MSQLMPKSQVRIPNTAEIVARKLRRAIVEGSIGSGENLPPEAKLIEMFEVSRPCIREAIRLLEFENLISISRAAAVSSSRKAGSAIAMRPSARSVDDLPLT